VTGPSMISGVCPWGAAVSLLPEFLDMPIELQRLANGRCLRVAVRLTIRSIAATDRVVSLTVIRSSQEPSWPHRTSRYHEVAILCEEIP
jgi:hypothetical protein